jgi:ribosomal 50S subunit-recycling heat shock protein
MRLDLFLKASRLCLRRTIAQKICEAGRVSVNGKTAKSSHVVKPGDLLQIETRSKVIKVTVLAIPSGRQTSRKEAGALYQLVSEEVVDDTEL